MPFCPSCGSPVDEGERYCRRCGAAQPPRGSVPSVAPRGGTAAGRPQAVTKEQAVNEIYRALNATEGLCRRVVEADGLLKEAKTAFEGGEWPRVVRLSKHVLALLGES